MQFLQDEHHGYYKDFLYDTKTWAILMYNVLKKNQNPAAEKEIKNKNEKGHCKAKQRQRADLKVTPSRK